MVALRIWRQKLHRRIYPKVDRGQRRQSALAVDRGFGKRTFDSRSRTGKMLLKYTKRFRRRIGDGNEQTHHALWRTFLC